VIARSRLYDGGHRDLLATWKKYLTSGFAATIWISSVLHAQPFGADLAERTLYTGAANEKGASVPVTARLSKRFYEQLGDDIANELVDWFNQVDATYRTDLRELNELNFSRFDAKVEQRFAESEARVEKRFVQFQAQMDQRFVQFQAQMDQRFVQFEAQMDQRFIKFQAQMEQRFVRLETRVDTKLAEQREFLERRLGEQTRWFYAAWAVQMAATVAVLVRIYLG
jgi:exonuclease VII large subunit